jgi:alcohol dehydrogenase class IV
MWLDYDLLTPGRICFGWGRREEVGRLAATLGRRAFLVCGSRTLASSGGVDEIERLLGKEGVQTVPLNSISREPEVADVDQTVELLRKQNAGNGDLLLAIGGGSAIDLAKAVAALATNQQGGSVLDFLEGVGRGLKIETPPLPMLAMPTTAGTGSEATKNAVISSYDPPFKKSLRSERMLPNVVLVDPELSVTVPPKITAQTGMDAITQLIESYISCRAQPVPQALCLQGLELALPAITTAVADGSSRSARERMSHAALLSGLALANSGLGMAHGVAAALGVHAKVPHGLACAVMLPVALEVNWHHCDAQLVALGCHCLGFTEGLTNSSEIADAFIDHVTNITAQVGIPHRLRDIGVEPEQLADIVQSSRGNSMSGNPRELSDDELYQILEDLL